MPHFPTKQKRGIITMLVSGFIGLAYEGISSFLHNRRHKAQHKSVKGMDKKAMIWCNKPMHLEDSMVMYGIFNAETLENSQTLYIIHIAIQHQMKNYLQDNLAQFWFSQYMLI